MHLLVAGTPRSGTTLLACMIGAHPDCIMMSECFSAEEHKIVSPARVIGNKLCMPNQLQFTHPPPRVSLRRIPHRVVRGLGALIPGLAPKELPLSRLSVQEYVRERKASILLVVRRPGHVVDSMLRRDEWTLDEAISRWAQGIREMHRAYDAFQDRSHIVSFESLVESPEEKMRDVSEFLDVPYNTNMLEGYKSTPQYERESIDSSAASGPSNHKQVQKRAPESFGLYRALRERSS